MGDVKYKKIYSKKIFLELILRCHERLWTEPNRNKKWLNVFVFKMDETLLIHLSEITKKK